tara:strand:- start:61 stop:930 length:870 start_codon:yes stop_codon:yes gene_type:complete
MSDSKNSTPKSNDLPSETLNLIEEAEAALNKKNDLIYDKQNIIDKEFSEIKKSAQTIEDSVKEKTSEISKKINNQELQIKKLKDEKIFFDRNKIQSDILNNQKLLIEKHKQNNENLKSDMNNLDNKLKIVSDYNEKLITNNTELKDTITRFISHNKNLQNDIEILKEEQSETLKIKSQILELSDQIKFYQEDNTRLSSEVMSIKKKYEIIKNNFNSIDQEKNEIFQQIHELNNSLTKTNIVGTPFVKDKVKVDNINSKVLSDISKANLDSEDIRSETNNLDKEINEIFK